MAASKALLLLLFVPLALAGCAADGDYPSLAVRPGEVEQAADLPERQPTPIPADAALTGDIERLLADARRGAAEFEAALPAAQAAVGRAGGAGSDSWVEAQQAVSRLEAARAATTRALADLDSLALQRAEAGRLGGEDRARLEALIAEVQGLADSQADRVRRLEAALKPA